MKENCCDSIKKITILSDGAASHFKNRFQLDELKRAPYDIKWLFSATGHGKGVVDGVDGLIKHYALRIIFDSPLKKLFKTQMILQYMFKNILMLLK